MSRTRSQAKARSTELASAMQRSAERRQCPNCGRKSALTRDEDATYCRWDCGYWKVADTRRTEEE